ncbi:MAG: glycosyltransferase family 4 protein, partial [Lachnospiraceae bacterium]|nr:glycosyltransferase family 4 protein [Lachnospiraceae bacterium]
IEVIPFSVNNPQNEPTEYSKYFAKPRSKQLMYADTKKTFSNLMGMLRATIWNYDAERRLRRLIRDTKPDAVYILHEINHLSPSIIRAAKKEGIRVVHRISDFFMFCAKYDFLYGEEICEACIHRDYSEAIKKRCVKDSDFGTRLRIAAMKLYWMNGVFDDVDAYISTCEFSKVKMIEGGIPKGKIVCIPTFIDFTGIKPSYIYEHYFLFLGRMAHQKGTIYAIQAMEYLKDTDYVLKITGSLTNSDEDQLLWNYINKHGLENKIVFTGFLHGKELEMLISQATCIICPAIWYENMPNTVIEAYAYGKPVIASNIGSLAEIVEDGKTGYLFETKNAKDLSEKCMKLVNNPALCRALGENARRICESKYNVEKHMDKVIMCLKGN